MSILRKLICCLRKLPSFVVSTSYVVSKFFSVTNEPEISSLVVKSAVASVLETALLMQVTSVNLFSKTFFWSVLYASLDGSNAIIFAFG